jgi:hypothetical protein
MDLQKRSRTAFGRCAWAGAAAGVRGLVKKARFFLPRLFARTPSAPHQMVQREIAKIESKSLTNLVKGEGC